LEARDPLGAASKEDVQGDDGRGEQRGDDAEHQ